MVYGRAAARPYGVWRTWKQKFPCGAEGVILRPTRDYNIMVRRRGCHRSFKVSKGYALRCVDIGLISINYYITNVVIIGELCKYFVLNF